MLKTISDYMGNLQNKNGVGFCLVCAAKIKQNIEKPFCIDCSLKNPIRKITDRINGYYCHACKKYGEYSNHLPYCRSCIGHDVNSDSMDDFYSESLTKYQTFDKQLIQITWDYEKANQIVISNRNRKLESIAIEDLISMTGLRRMFNLEDIFMNDIKSNKKILNILDRWKNKLVITPPHIIFENGRCYYKDGRHRTISTYYLNKNENIPVIVELKLK